MTAVNLSLNSIDKVKTFVNVINTFEGDFDLSSDRYVIDAKSIMGIFSLDISNAVKLTIHNDSEAEAVKAALADFIVD
jgi:phosphotransferase system HPr-like phosphotransfer protein